MLVAAMILCQECSVSRNTRPTAKFASSARLGTPERPSTCANHSGRKRLRLSEYTSRLVAAVNTSAEPPGETIESA